MSLRRYLIASVGVFAGITFLFFADWKQQPKETISLRFESEIYPVRPWEAPGQDWGRVRRQVFEKLFDVSLDGRIEARVAADWEVSRDFRKYTISLNEGIKFSDGSNLTSSDVIESLRTFREQGGDSGSSYVFSLIDSMEAIGDYQINFLLKKPYYEFLSFLASPAAEIRPSETASLWDPMACWVGSGPYMMESMEDNSIRLKANPYYRKDVRFAAIEMKAVHDAKKALEDGTVDYIEIARDEVPTYSRDERYHVSSHPMLGSFFVGFNLKRPGLQNLNIRKALYHALDRSKAVENYTVKPHQIPKSIIPYGLLGYEADPESYDLELARKYLNEIPAKELPKKNDLEILIPRTPHPMTRFGADFVAKALQDLGLPSSVRELDVTYGRGKLGDFYHHLRTKRSFGIYLRGMILTVPSTSMIYEQVFHPDSPMNFGGYESKRFWQVFERGPKSILDDDLKVFYEQLNNILYEEMPVIPMGILFVNNAARIDAPRIGATLSPYFLDLNKKP